MTDPAVAILAYHKIGDPGPGGWPTWFYVPEPTFAAHLDWLAESGWATIDLATLLAGLRDPAALPPRAVLLTFDDGYRSVRDVALPWLKRFGCPAVLFVPTDFVGATNAFDRDNEPEEPLCDWRELRDLAHASVSIQSHGASHRAFSCLGGREQEDELQRSRAALEAGLGDAVEMFAFPYGDAGQDPAATRRLLERTGYRAACLYPGGLARWPVDPYALPRIPMGPDTDLRAVLSVR